VKGKIMNNGKGVQRGNVPMLAGRQPRLLTGVYPKFLDFWDVSPRFRRGAWIVAGTAMSFLAFVKVQHLQWFELVQRFWENAINLAFVG
jgi:hypothetical protein